MQLSKEASQPFLDVDRAVLGCPLPQQIQYTLCLPVELNDLAMNSSQASLPAEQTDSGATGRAHDTNAFKCLQLLQCRLEREREIHYIFSSHLRADQMCRGSFLGIHQ